MAIGTRFKRTGTTGRERAAKAVDPFYRSKDWYRFRYHVLKRDNWTCQVCGVRIGKKGGHVDHILSRHDRPDLAFDLRNARTCCASCHSRKTVLQDGGMGNVRTAGPGATPACTVQGEPSDPGHPWNR